MSTARWRVLYDEGCGFCRWCVGVLLALDRRHELRPVAIGSHEGAMLLGDLDERARWDSWHLVDPQGRRTSAGAAVAPLLDLQRAGHGGRRGARGQQIQERRDRGAGGRAPALRVDQVP